ncbi:MAG: AraC family transcriptional regulator [Paenibacillus sp.]|jgi:AraC-like DNA-binding protein|nr:AraC family transcriptional regulator [Paenibacillus sp.]
MCSKLQAVIVMQTISGTTFLPKIRFYSYFLNREKFTYFEETYTDWTVFAIENGSFHYDLNGSTGTASFGDLLFCPPGFPVRRVVISPLTFHFMHFHWENGEGVEVDATEVIPQGKISILHTQRLSFNYEELRNVNSLPFHVKSNVQNHYLQDIWYTYLQELQMRSSRKSNNTKKSPLMMKAAAIIEQRAFESFDLKTIASELNISPYQFSRAFKAAFGITPLLFLSSIRLEKAKTLLIETELTLAQVAECCGYQTGYYLNKLFMKNLYMTPTQFRKSHRV